MNIKIKATGVACLIGDDYDRVYATLKKQLGEGDEQLFTERTPGHEYLQWELPGEGWTALSEGDPLMASEVRKEWLRRQQAVCTRFGKNQEMAQRVLSVPDESYVFYKADGAGRLLIRLTAWGYRYPERVQGGAISGQTKPKGQTEHVVVRLMYDGQPLPAKPFYMNGFVRQTDVEGRFEVGDLPLGYGLDLEADGLNRHVDVALGEGEIDMDLTVFTTVEVVATLDGQPYKGGMATLSYGGRHLSLVTDGQGRSTAKLPLDLHGAPCTVTLGSETQQMPLSKEGAVFAFHLETPKPEVPPEVYGIVSLDATLDGKPCQATSALLEYAGRNLSVTTDSTGHAEARVLLKEGELCSVTLGGETQQKPLSEGVTAFRFCLKGAEPVEEPRRTEPSPEAPEEAAVEVKALSGQQPYAGKPVSVAYGTHRVELVTDCLGLARTRFPLDAKAECVVSLEGKTQRKPLSKGANAFVFHFESPQPVIVPIVEEEKPLSSGFLWKTAVVETLARLFIVALVIATYLLGAEILWSGN